MKKFSLSYISIWISIAAILGFFLGHILGVKGSFKEQLIIGFGATLFILLVMGASIFLPLSKYFVNKTMKKIYQLDFHISTHYDSPSSMLYIDSVNGKIALTTLFNPFHIQFIDINKLTDIRPGYVAGILGRTGKTYFSFTIDHTVCKITTFLDNDAQPLDSPEVVKGLNDANQYVAILKAAQKTNKFAN